MIKLDKKYRKRKLQKSLRTISTETFSLSVEGLKLYLLGRKPLLALIAILRLLPREKHKLLVKLLKLEAKQTATTP